MQTWLTGSVRNRSGPDSTSLIQCCLGGSVYRSSRDVRLFERARDLVCSSVSSHELKLPVPGRLHGSADYIDAGSCLHSASRNTETVIGPGTLTTPLREPHRSGPPVQGQVP